MKLGRLGTLLAIAGSAIGAGAVVYLVTGGGKAAAPSPSPTASNPMQQALSGCVPVTNNGVYPGVLSVAGKNTLSYCAPANITSATNVTSNSAAAKTDIVVATSGTKAQFSLALTATAGETASFALAWTNTDGTTGSALIGITVGP